MAGSGQFYGANAWDPVLIVAQMGAMQALHYLTLGALLLVLVAPYGSVTLHHFFDYRTLSTQHFIGWMTILAHSATALVGAFLLTAVVERAKKCLDFTATIYILHLMATVGFGGFPTSAAWWITEGLAFGLMVVLGEWLCARREMRDISLPTVNTRDAASARSTSVRSATSLGDELRGEESQRLVQRTSA